MNKLISIQDVTFPKCFEKNQIRKASLEIIFLLVKICSSQAIFNRNMNLLDVERYDLVQQP